MGHTLFSPQSIYLFIFTQRCLFFVFFFMTDLFADEAKAAVVPHALVRLPQDGVEGLVAVSEGGGGVARDGEGGDVDLTQHNQTLSLFSTSAVSCLRLG